MNVEAVELRTVRMPLVAPFRTSFGTQFERETALVRVITDAGEGWGECAALPDPLYSAEYVAGAIDVLRRYLVPAVLAQADLQAESVAQVLTPFRGHRMAKSALEMALLDAQLRAAQQSFAAYLGAVHDRVDCGVSVGITSGVEELVDVVGGFLDAGYRRIKLKIEPGWDVAPVRAVRERFGPDLMLQVDANAAYTRDDSAALAELDEFDLLLIEQPLPEEDLAGHAELARRIDTPVCLDESIVSAQGALDAIDMGACAIVNIKPGRVGGYLEARRVHDVCRERQVPVWCGGMLETGIGRGANLALAALPGFTLPGDTSASDRFYAADLTDPFVMTDGRLDVPNEAGLARRPHDDALAEFTSSTELVLPAGRR